MAQLFEPKKKRYFVVASDGARTTTSPVMLTDGEFAQLQILLGVPHLEPGKRAEGRRTAAAGLGEAYQALDKVIGRPALEGLEETPHLYQVWNDRKPLVYICEATSYELFSPDEVALIVDSFVSMSTVVELANVYVDNDPNPAFRNVRKAAIEHAQAVLRTIVPRVNGEKIVSQRLTPDTHSKAVIDEDYIQNAPGPESPIRAVFKPFNHVAIVGMDFQGLEAEPPPVRRPAREDLRKCEGR